LFCFPAVGTLEKIISKDYIFQIFKPCGKIFILKKMPQLLWQKNHFEKNATEISRVEGEVSWVLEIAVDNF